MLKKLRYIQYTYNKIFILSIISGFPLGIIYSSIFVWLQEYNIDIVLITSLLIVRIPYSLKFLWGNIIEYLSSEHIKKIGAKKIWLIFSVIFMSVILLILSYSNPVEELTLIYFLCFSLAIVSSIYDTSFESFRLEYIKYYSHDTSKIITWSSFGHKIGILFASVMNLIIADYIGWGQAFFVSSIVLLFSVFYIIIIPDFKNYEKYSIKSYLAKIHRAYKEFSSRENWKSIFISILFLKIGKTMLSSTILIYYRFLGFSKTQLAFFSNIYDFFVFCLGVFTSYHLVKIFEYKKTLIICFSTQFFVYPLFILLGQMNSVSVWLVITTIDGFCTGMIINIYIIYINQLVNKKFLTIQYSFFTSVSNIINNLVSILFSGFIIKFLDWNIFFILVTLFSLPGLISFIISNKRELQVKINKKL